MAWRTRRGARKARGSHVGSSQDAHVPCAPEEDAVSAGSDSDAWRASGSLGPGPRPRAGGFGSGPPQGGAAQGRKSRRFGVETESPAQRNPWFATREGAIGVARHRCEGRIGDASVSPIRRTHLRGSRLGAPLGCLESGWFPVKPRGRRRASARGRLRGESRRGRFEGSRGGGGPSWAFEQSRVPCFGMGIGAATEVRGR